MDSNDIIENLWHEAVTIRAAVASAYEAVGGEGPLPASLVQALNYITEHAGGGDVPVGSSVVTDASLSQLATKVLGGDEGQTGQNLVDNVIIPTLDQLNGALLAQQAVNPTANWGQEQLLARVGYVTAALNTASGEQVVDYSGGLTYDLGDGYPAIGLAQFVDWFNNNSDPDIQGLLSALETTYDAPPSEWRLSQIVPFLMMFLGVGMESPTSFPPLVQG